MKTDYWQKFLESGSVQDYLNYRFSLNGDILQEENRNERNTESVRDSGKGDQNQRE